MSLVYCPSTHAYFFPTVDTTYPLKKALDAGVRVALGTDSRASSFALNLFREIQGALLGAQDVDPQQALRMGTLSGAEALGRDAEVGSITPGKLANLVAIPIPEDTPGVRNEILSAMLRKQWSDVLASILARLDTKPSAVYLAGRPLNF
jgi:cytosine/adenosine deaminase-related metal-dependent hydrolase